MNFQTRNSINVREMKCYTGDYRFKLATTVATQYKLKHHIRYVVANGSWARPNLKKTD